jgi:glutamine cyclotransferase
VRNTIIAVLLALIFLAGRSVADGIVAYDYQVVAVYPHDRSAFTQGLLIKDGDLYESTGQRGHSSIRQVDLATGGLVRKHDLDDRYFGEGIVDWNDQLIAVTWQSGTGLVFQLEDFRELKSFNYVGEGWGLTRDHEKLIMSDGSDKLRFFDPDTFEEIGSVAVTFRGKRVRNLNELEWIEGSIFANVWNSDLIVQIDPETGEVNGLLNLTGLLPESEQIRGQTDVLNGIAYDAEAKRMFVTGKYWPKIFEIELIAKPVGETN